MREYQQSLYLVHGVEGVGLTTFSVKAASYLMERRVFEYFFFIDLYEIRDSTLFRFKFNEVTKFDLDNEMYETSIKTKKILFLLDNCDDFLKISSRQFYAELQTLIREFPKSKIIFILKDNNYQ